MDLEEYKQHYTSTDACPGWDAIDVALDGVYPEQEPLHWGTLIKHRLGGPDPLDGISAYKSQAGGIAHKHFCSYGFSALYYDEEAAGGEFSKFGFELTFRIINEGAQEPVWVCNLMQNLARYVFSSGRWFEPLHWLPANGPIKADDPTEIVGLIFLPDPELPPILTPHGKVEFLQMFGVTEGELEQIKTGVKSAEQIIAEHAVGNPYLITDLLRKNAS
jgi:hypothetical protein